jgi:hypothetical protein
VRGGWIRLGRVLEAARGPLDRSHVMLPTPWRLDDRVRVYFASCDEDMRGRVFAAEFGPEPPFPLLAVSREPALDIGPPGAFDCDGVNPSQIVEIDGRLALLYIGWRRGEAQAPYTLIAGLAFSSDHGRTFVSNGPLLPPRQGETLFRTAPFLRRETDGYRLLYIGGEAFFTSGQGKRLPLYSLMELRSDDPWRWQGPGRTVIAPDRAAGEIGFGRPVIRDDEEAGPKLMISVRSTEGYELVEGDDPDRVEGRPALTPVFDPPHQPWERAMRCFGAPCLVGGYELLFYNGDDFGRSGLGLAYRVRDSR